MRRNRGLILLLLLTIFFVGLGAGYGLSQITPTSLAEERAPLDPSIISQQLEQNQARWEAIQKALEYTTSVRLITVGDIMMHDNQLEAGLISSEEGYQFDSYFTAVTPLFREGDWVLGNLETTLAGEEQRYTGYPMFNSPDELAHTLKAAGFHVLTTANNHSLDRREFGVLRTLERLDEEGLLHTGTFRSAEERAKPLLLTKNRITIALFAYTYGTNGIPIPEGKDYLVNLIDLEQMKGDIAQARAEGADVVAMAVHFGNEYQRQPSPQQLELVDQLFALGVDIIYGSHPHVVQPFEIRTWVDEEGEEQTGVVIYSLGNFISDQRGDFKDIGLIFDLTIEKEFPSQRIKLTNIQAIPTYVNRYWQEGKRVYRILPLEQVVKDQGAEGITPQQLAHLEQQYENISQHVHSWLDESVMKYLRTPAATY